VPDTNMRACFYRCPDAMIAVITPAYTHAHTHTRTHSSYTQLYPHTIQGIG